MSEQTEGKAFADRINLRPVSDSDSEFLFDLFCSLRAGYFENAGLDDSLIGQLLRMQYEFQINSYRTHFPGAEHCIILFDERRAGRMMVDRSMTELRLIDISIGEEFRGSGIGSRLVSGLIAEAAAGRIPVTLTVAADNLNAQRLYDRLGFLRTGTDDVYISMERKPD